LTLTLKIEEEYSYERLVSAKNIYSMSEPRIPHSEKSPTSKPEKTFVCTCFGVFYNAVSCTKNEVLHSREGQRGMFGDHVFEGPKSTLALSYTQLVSEYLLPS